MTLIPCVLVYHFLKYVVPFCFLFSRYFSQSEEYWQWFCNVTECYICVFLYIIQWFFLSMYISTYLYLSNLSQAFPPETTTPGESSKGVPTRPTQLVPLQRFRVVPNGGHQATRLRCRSGADRHTLGRGDGWIPQGAAPAVSWELHHYPVVSNIF